MLARNTVAMLAMLASGDAGKKHCGHSSCRLDEVLCFVFCREGIFPAPPA
jgi:hypothetical protein